ncbi:MAG TPA: hypothetical protein IGS17_02275 [Oscillatoriales cyanobacterium M59_W2019_021]|nr:hypothetical protein [Oscillatoriales cyanobacterium M4454_W2019_049]HIK49742.1 hypothetical protein [Oscillatoriales cyanobacterium M59_W2019_021]
MNFESSNDARMAIAPDRQPIFLSYLLTRRKVLGYPISLALATLPLLLAGLPALAFELPLIERGYPSRIAVSPDRNLRFPTPIAARGEEDEKCIWLGVCN